MGSLSKSISKSVRMSVGMVLQLKHITKQPNKLLNTVRVITFFLKLILIVARGSTSFIKMGVAYMYQGV